MRILIAEDDGTSRSILSAVLKKLGHDPVAVEEGNAAYDIMQKTDAPQLAILDWEMPGLDGAALCQKLREQDRKIPLYLILLTSKRDTEDIVQGLEAGADDYMIKPYNNAELQARVNAGCRMIEIQNKMMEQEKLQAILEMAGAVCHEFNQPLQIICGYCELLKDYLESNSKSRKYIEVICKEVSKLGSLTRDVMNITEYETKPYLNSKIVDIKRSSDKRHC